MEVDAQRIILDELNKNSYKYVPRMKGNSVWVACPFLGETVPSLKINLETTSQFPVGSFFCFGCGKSGLWNKFAQKGGLRKLREVDTQQTHVVNRMKRMPEDTIESVLASFGASIHFPYDAEKWRGVKQSLLTDIGACKIFDKAMQDYAVVLPVYVLGKCVGGIKAALTKRKNGVSYINSTGEWTKLRGLFPYDYAVKLALETGATSIALVEGPRDALRLLQNGIPAMSILGIRNWSQAKIDLLLATGLDILVVMDGDKAGVSATNTIRRDLKQYMNAEYIRMMDYSKLAGKKIDPANCSPSVVREIKRLCYLP